MKRWRANRASAKERDGLSDREVLALLEAEQRTLERFVSEKSLDALNDLLALYQWMGCEDRLREVLGVLIRCECRNDLERRARLKAYLGQSHQRTGEYGEAIREYQDALDLEPCDPWTEYLVHNSLATCLNRLERFAEAERHCEIAISLNQWLPSCWRNLGVCLAGQRNCEPAFVAFVRAVRVNPADERAHKLLEALVDRCPQLLESAWVRQRLAECRRAVEFLHES